MFFSFGKSYAQIVCPPKCAPQTCTLETNAVGSGFSYVWDDSSTGATLIASTSGTYCVTISDSTVPLNCERDTCFVVVINPEPTIMVQNIIDICEEPQPLTITSTPSGGTAPYTYLWSNGDNTQTATITETTNNADLTLTYTVTVTDANGCTGEGSDTFILHCVPTASVLSTTEDCNNCDGSVELSFGNHLSRGAIEFSINGGSTYPHSFADNSSPRTITGLCAGTYDLWVRWGNTECPIDLPDFTITSINCCNMTASITGATEICDGDSEQLFATETGGTAPITYLWSDNSTGQFVNWTSTQAWSVTVTDANGCTATATENTTANPNPDAACSKTDGQCGGLGSATVNATSGTAPYSYAWSNSATTTTINNLADGIYTVTVTDSKGCQDICDVTISNEPDLTIACNGTDATCGSNNGSATVTVNTGTAPYSYSWSNSGNTATINNLSAGTYTVTVTDANNCTKTCSHVVGDTGGFVWNPGCS